MVAGRMAAAVSLSPGGHEPAAGALYLSSLLVLPDDRALRSHGAVVARTTRPFAARQRCRGALRAGGPLLHEQWLWRPHRSFVPGSGLCQYLSVGFGGHRAEIPVLPS